MAFVALALMLTIPSALGAEKPGKIGFPVIAYLPDYRTDSFTHAALAYTTDLIYFSIQPKADGSLDTGLWSPTIIQRLNQIKTDHPVRRLIAIGGWERSAGFVPVAMNDQIRALFVKNLVQFCIKNQLSGIDYDWEHPDGGNQEKAYAELIADTKKGFAPHHLMVSVTVASWQKVPIAGFLAADRVQIMSYDNPGQHSTFVQAKKDLNLLAAQGVPKSKLVLGLPFYGRSVNNGNSLMYTEIVAKYHPAPNVDTVGETYFNGIDTIQRKTKLALYGGYGGVMLWELGQDTNDQTSLLLAIHQVIVGPRKPSN